MHQCNQMLCFKHALLPWLPIQASTRLEKQGGSKTPFSLLFWIFTNLSHTSLLTLFPFSYFRSLLNTPGKKKHKKTLPFGMNLLGCFLLKNITVVGRGKKQSYASDFWRRTRVGGGSVTEFFINTLAGLAILFTPHTLVFRPGSKAQAAVTSSIGAVVQSHWKMNSKHI